MSSTSWKSSFVPNQKRPMNTAVSSRTTRNIFFRTLSLIA